MCLKVYHVGIGDSEGTHISIYLHLMKGLHDDKLEQSGHWPLRGTFTIELLNQFSVQSQLMFSSHSCSECTNRVVNGDIATKGWNHPWSVLHNNTQWNNSNNNTFCFRVSYDDSDPSILPVILTVSNFTEKMKNKELFNSLFFAFDGGYLMFIRVYAAGSGKGEVLMYQYTCIS